jgi:ATP-dependent RNA helicase RhlE
MKHLDHVGFSVASIHGNKSQGQRERALKAFRDGGIKALIATDVAARGIDIPAVSHVYNYDLPEVPDAYVHRIGRTARAGRDGIAIAFCAPDEARLLRDIEKLMGIEIAVASGEPPADMRAAPRRGNGGNRGRGNQPRGGEGRSEPRPGNRQERRPRPDRENHRNEDFRGQRRGEPRPDTGPDNDLASTSDFRPARKPQHPAPQAVAGEPSGHHRGKGRHAHGRPSRNHGEERGPQPHGGERRDGNGGNRRGGRNGGQRRERA